MIGPRGDAYAPGATLSAEQAASYHATQLGWLAETEVDMVTALTHTQGDEAAGFSRAAKAAGLPHVISFTVETDGRLPTGETLAEAIGKVDAASDGAAAYFMVNCAHPDHFSGELTDAPWARRIRGLRCNASRKSHAELDASETSTTAIRMSLRASMRRSRRGCPGSTSSAAAAAPTFAM